MSLDLTLACDRYPWTRPLWDGRVCPEGVDLATVDFSNPERFTRMVEEEAFDVCEFSMGSYLAARAGDGEFPATAIPVFPYRRLRHSFVYRRADSDVTGPADLASRRVGLVNWQTTTGIWQRGILAGRHGLDLGAVDWVATGTEIVDVSVPDEVSLTYRRAGTESAIPALEAALEAGRIDAALSPVHLETDAVERLFDDPLEVERHYLEETGIFPIMHAIVVRDELRERHPWVVQKLYDAFVAARDEGLSGLDRPRELPLVSSRPLVERQRDLLGECPWAYGLGESNRATLSTLVAYAADQGILDNEPPIEELFATDRLAVDWFGG